MRKRITVHRLARDREDVEIIRGTIEVGEVVEVVMEGHVMKVETDQIKDDTIINLIHHISISNCRHGLFHINHSSLI